MVYETLQILKEQLEKYLDDAGLGKIVVLENLALLDSGTDKAKNLEGKVIISLLSVQEESTLKNLPTSHVVNNKAEYYNPAVNINLFFMVSANCDIYSNSLISITKTLEYFQGKKVFTAQNTVYNRSNLSMQELDDFKFVVDLYTPGFEVWNHIWGTHGGRQLPSVIYKVQLLQVDRRKKQASTELITKIKGTLKDIN
ncbi:DUF4255 domain-containing protein [uncultured Draconibacterium sp.]|uniref:DUF4255 domain-containing protein n=1 Tax=uncultured Draconibacterium sp. TaxID=1573823 RepID=UPI0029C7B52E|nr:DUF4255 domain-containing protein [uncultured Draconibacterium sp.]